MNRAERRRAARQPRGFDAMVKRALADGAARDLLQTIAEAQELQATIEKFGLDTGMSPGCVSESGEPLKTWIAGVDAENRVIVVTRNARFGPPVWLYATRAEALALMLRPAIRAFENATETLSYSTALIQAARAALDRAMQWARACDAVKAGAQPMTKGRLSGSSRGRSSKSLSSASHRELRRASPAENVRMGFSPKARRYVKAGVKVTKATASVSPGRAETKRTKARYGFATPEAATRARKEGALAYESRAQGERVAKAKQTGFFKRLFGAGQDHKRLFERSRDGEIKLNRRGRKRGFTATPDRVAYVEDLRERKLAGEMLDRGEWFMLMNYAEALGDPALSRLRNSGSRRAQEQEPDEGDYYEEG